MASKYPQNQNGFSRHFKGAGFVLLGVGIFLTSFLRQCNNPPTPERFPAAELPVVTTPRAQTDAGRRVDELCASLPAPEKFEFLSKSAPGETGQFAAVAYNFRSPRGKAEIYPLFIVWFTQNDWTDNKPAYERLEFSRDNQTVTIAPQSTGEGSLFTVNCTEWKIAPEDSAPPIKTPDQKR